MAEKLGRMPSPVDIGAASTIFLQNLFPTAIEC